MSRKSRYTIEQKYVLVKIIFLAHI